MAEELRERNQIDPRYTWDLSSLFDSDEQFEEELQKIGDLVRQTAEYEGKLTNAQAIHEYLELTTLMSRKMDDLFTYSMLRRSEDMRSARAQSLYARAYGKYVEAMTANSFAEPEILSIDMGELEKIVADPVLSDYSFIMQNYLKKKPHVLSAAEERVLASFGEVFGAPKQIAENLRDADMTFESAADANGELHELNESNYILLQSQPDRTLRENSFRNYYKTFRGHSNTLAAAYSAAVKAEAAEAQLRHYSSSREMSMSDNNIPTHVYDNLIEAVHRHMPAMYRYVKLRKRLLGLDELHYYDVYAPLVDGVEEHYTYEQAQEMVLNAVSVLGTNYTDVVRDAFASRWIDVFPNKGKQGGAYSSGTYDSKPYIMTNFTGTLDSVSTIAHEMGHSMHSWHSIKNQPPQYAQYTLFVAEVASTVNENLLIEQLLEKTQDPAKRLSLLNQYLENFKGTVYRQTMFAEFEKQAHEMAERGEALSPEVLGGLYHKLIEEYFGPEMVIDEEVDSEWSRIPHFFRPFYVYVYATGYSTAVALSEGILKDGEPAVKKYLEFLSMGGSAYPLDELRHAGVDLDTPEPIDRALEKFERIVEEAEKMADLLGK